MESPEHRPHHPPSRSASGAKPKGILKNAPHSHSQGQQTGGQQHNLQWDEENLALTEINKDSLMKITEPKTPYVRYNALTDEIEGDIPDLSLSGGYSSQGGYTSDGATSSPLASPTALAHDTASAAGGDAKGKDAADGGPPSRRTSISSTGRPGTAMSGTSSRSTSFNLPNEARKEIRADATQGADEVEVDEEEMDEETAAKHAAFVRARKGHYSNEAEAMKRAAQLMDEEDDSAASNAPSDTNDDDESMYDDEDDEEGSGEGRRVVPPVPPLPKGVVNGAGPSSRA